jgi:hypothetical protein
MGRTHIETFTAEQVAEIAADVERVPSANDMFVRYEDHRAAVIEAAGFEPLVLPPMAVRKETGLADALAEAGYSRSNRKGDQRAGEGSFFALWQKRIEDEAGTRYFVNFTEYNPGFYSLTEVPHVFEAEVHFRFTNGGHSNITHSVDRQAIEDIEDYFEEIWTHMGMGYAEGGPDYAKAARAAGDVR